MGSGCKRECDQSALIGFALCNVLWPDERKEAKE